MCSYYVQIVCVFVECVCICVHIHDNCVPACSVNASRVGYLDLLEQSPTSESLWMRRYMVRHTTCV